MAFHALDAARDEPGGGEDASNCFVPVTVAVEHLEHEILHRARIGEIFVFNSAR